MSETIYGKLGGSSAAPIQAESKSQYKRLVAQGANVVQPAATSETWRTILDDVLWPSDPDYTRMENAVEDLERRLMRFERLESEAGDTLRGRLDEWERAEAAERERDALRIDIQRGIKAHAEEINARLQTEAELASAKDDSDMLDWVLANCQLLILDRGVVLPANTREEIDKARAAKGGKT